MQRQSDQTYPYRLVKIQRQTRLFARRGYPDLRFLADTYNEFVLECPGPAQELHAKLLEANIVAGLPLGNFYPELDNCLLLCATEMNSLESLNQFADQLAYLVNQKQKEKNLDRDSPVSKFCRTAVFNEIEKLSGNNGFFDVQTVNLAYHLTD